MVKVEVNVDKWHGPVIKNGEVLLPCKKGDVIIVQKKTWEDMQTSTPNCFSYVGEFDPKDMKAMTPGTSPEDKLDFKNKMMKRKS